MSEAINAAQAVALTIVENEPVLAVFLLFTVIFALGAVGLIGLFTWRTSKSSAESSGNTAALAQSVISLGNKLDDMQLTNIKRHDYAEIEIGRLQRRTREHAEHIAENRTRITTLETDFSKIAKRTDDEKIDNASD